MAQKPKILDPTASPAARFGAALRKQRTAAKLSQDALADMISYAGSTIGAVERGDIFCKRDLAVGVDRALGLPDALTSVWDAIAEGDGAPEWFADWPEHECSAVLLRSYEGFVSYGLLQTEAYARALLHGDEAAVARRMQRQEILTGDDAPQLYALLDQSALLREVGNPRVMREQLEQLASINSHKIALQIVPMRQHRGDSGNFVIATALDETTEVAYLDTAVGGRTVNDRRSIRSLARTFDAIRSRALPIDQSKDLILRTVERRWT